MDYEEYKRYKAVCSLSVYGINAVNDCSVSLQRAKECYFKSLHNYNNVDLSN